MSSSEEEEEEILLHVEFNGMLEKNLLENPTVCKIIGLNSQKPVMQIGNQTFTGEYKDTVGTAMFFEEDEDPPGGDPVFSKPPEHQLRYVCKTRKSLHMSRVFLKKKFKQEKKTHPASDESDIDPVHEALIRAYQDNASVDSERPSLTPASYEPVAGPSWAPDVPYVGIVPPFES